MLVPGKLYRLCGSPHQILILCYKQINIPLATILQPKNLVEVPQGAIIMFISAVEAGNDGRKFMCFLYKKIKFYLYDPGKNGIMFYRFEKWGAR